MQVIIEKCKNLKNDKSKFFKYAFKIFQIITNVHYKNNHLYAYLYYKL